MTTDPLTYAVARRARKREFDLLKAANKMLNDRIREQDELLNAIRDLFPRSPHKQPLPEIVKEGLEQAYTRGIAHGSGS